MNIQIPVELMAELIEYFYPESDTERPEGTLADSIRRQIEDKMQKITNRALFSEYKTATTADQRESARRAYLKERGFTDSFISGSEIKIR